MQFLPHVAELVLCKAGKQGAFILLSFCRTGRLVPSKISMQSSPNRSTLSILMITPRLQLIKFSRAVSFSSICAKLHMARYSPSSVVIRT